MTFNICVPIPVKSANVIELKSIIEKTLRSNPNLVEFRYDFIDNVKHISQDLVNVLLANVQPKIPVIFTFRARQEGGQMQIDEKTRLKIIKTLVLSKPNYLDIEMNTEKRMLSELIDLASQNDVKLILSNHNFDDTPSFDIIANQIQKFPKILKEEFGLDSKRMKETIIKLIFQANSFEDNLLTLKICKEFSKKNKIISFCMGSLGIFSRVLCVLNGSFLTYGSIVDETAPGQINIKTLRETLKFLE